MKTPMRAMINHIYNLYPPAEADRIAAEMNADPEDDWTYKANHDPAGTGHSFIEIYDETGELVGRL